MDRIAELEAEIALKMAELKQLKEGNHLDFSDYNSFDNEKYSNYSLGQVISPELRSLAIRMLTIEEKTRPYDESKYLTTKPKPKVKQMTKEEISFCNAFIKELYPIIEKYTRIVLLKKE